MCISFVGFVFFSIGLGMLLSKLEDGSRVIIQLNQAMYVMVMKFIHHIQWSVFRRCSCFEDRKATVTPDRTISVSYDCLRLGQGASERQCLLRYLPYL